MGDGSSSSGDGGTMRSRKEDWLPTLAKLIGYQEPIESDGMDISERMLGSGGDPPTERELYWVWNSASNRWALRHGDWKIVRYGRGEPEGPQAWQLFHLGRDPKEQQDLSAEHPDVLAAMHQRFLRQRTRDRK